MADQHDGLPGVRVQLQQHFGDVAIERTLTARTFIAKK